MLVRFDLGVWTREDQALIATLEAHQEGPVLAAHFDDPADPIALVNSSAVLNDQISHVAVHPPLTFTLPAAPLTETTIGVSVDGCQRRGPR